MGEDVAELDIENCSSAKSTKSRLDAIHLKIPGLSLEPKESNKSNKSDAGFVYTPDFEPYNNQSHDFEDFHHAQFDISKKSNSKIKHWIGFDVEVSTDPKELKLDQMMMSF